MAIIKRIVCLANSRKRSGRCVAGKELSRHRPPGWIRPVSDREHEEVSEHECRYQDGSIVRVLDIIAVPLLDPRLRDYQQENWLLDPGHYWVKVGRATWSHLPDLADSFAPLWVNGHSTYNGCNDKIPLALAARLTSSLRLVQVDHLMLSVFTSGEAFGTPRRRVQGQFWHDGIEYRLWVTDPTWERAYLRRPDGDYEIGESFLTISLSEPYNDACYKLIAAIIQPDGETRL
ncbi:MAG TPA: hypothetical protein DEP84_17375 [Chloroflexi bacterium]|nr:hypothetical protein [Chloroflexota bacterium]